MKRYYLTSTSGIANYLYRTIKNFGFFVLYYNSDVSDSTYLYINLGTKESPVFIHVRISNHPVSRYNTDVQYDYDICGTHSRPGATTYIKFLSKFAKEHNKTLPMGLKALQPGTQRYKCYAIMMQKRAVSKITWKRAKSPVNLPIESM